MFTGIIQETPTIHKIGKGYLSIKVRRSNDKKGDSIAINGVCLTLVKKSALSGNKILSFDVSPETTKKTTFLELKENSIVNLERPMRASDVFGGHMVQGHVDATGKISKIKEKGKNKEIWFAYPKQIRPFLVPQGSITVDGISLTVAKLKKNEFMVAVIPHTLMNTNLKYAKTGVKVNLEGDIIGKYVSTYVRKK